MAKEQNTEKKNHKKNDESLKQRLEVLKICAQSFIDNKDFKHAEEYYLEMLELDEECFDAYLGLLLVDTKSADTNELFSYYLSQGFDANSKVSSAIKDLFDIRLKSLDKTSPVYQKFIFNTYRTIKGMYDDYLSSKDDTYERCIEEYENTTDIAILKKLIEQFESLNNYKDSAMYISRCRDKISNEYDLMEENARNEKLANLLTCARDFLSSGDSRLADDYFEEVLQLDPDNTEAYLGLLMVDTGTSDIDELFEYYRNLYIEDETEILEACKKDSKHINDMVSKYAVPSYLDPDTIRSYYEYDRSYSSVYKSRKEAKEKMFAFLNSDPYLSTLIRLKDKNVISHIEELKSFYEKRVKEARKQDKANAARISSNYQKFIFNTYRTIKGMYDDYLSSKDDTYERCIEEYENTTDIAILKKLIEQFESLNNYKDSAMYISRCRDKISNEYDLMEENARNEKLANLLTCARDFLSSGDSRLADDYFEEVLQLDPDNTEAYLGLLMVDTGTSDIDELFEYYRNLYIEDETEILEACKKDSKHINDMVSKYAVPSYLDPDTIRSYYDFDSSYISVLNSRKRHSDAVLEELTMNPLFVKIAQNDDERYQEIMKGIMGFYQDRVREAEELDEENIEVITQEYEKFLEETDQQIASLYEESKAKSDARKKEERAERKARRDQEKIIVPEENGRISEAYRLLDEDEYDKAKELFEKLVEKDPDDSLAYLGMILADIHKHDIDGMVDYYINLYDKEETEILQACEEEKEHIQEMAEHYATDDLPAAAIEKMYDYDRSYESTLSSRIMAKHDLYNDIYQNNYFINLDRIADPKIISRLENIVDAYDNRVSDAQKADDRKIAEITKQYHDHIKAIDEQLIKGEEKQKKQTNKAKKERARKMTMSIVRVVTIALLTIALGYTGYLKLYIPLSRYNKAISMIENKQYLDAISILNELNGYKDSANKINEAYYNLALEKYQNGEAIEALNILNDLELAEAQELIDQIRQEMKGDVKVGDTVIFGEYEQDGDSTNGREYLEWTVLDIEGDQALLISKYVVDAYRFDNSQETAYWDTSDLRFWLNEIFVGNAFYKESPSDIIATTVTSHLLDDDPNDSIDPDTYETVDRVFLLSSEEVEKYYPVPRSRIATATENVKGSGLFLEEDGSSGWWLRDPAGEGTSYYIWGNNGAIVTSMNSILQGIRPAMWIKLNH